LKGPKTTVIGSYPVFPRSSEVRQYGLVASHHENNSKPDLEEDEEFVDPYLATIEHSMKDFVSAGIEIPCTGQTRDYFTRIFLDPKFVEGIKRDGADIEVIGKIKRKSAIRINDVEYAKNFLPPYLKFKEPIADPYTLARSCKVSGRVYTDLKELAFSISRNLVRPEAEDLSKYVDFIQFDAPYYSIDKLPDYLGDLYEELTSGLNKPTVLHVCGDTFHIFKELTKLKVDILSLDFTYNPNLLDEVASRSFDQLIGFGCVNTGSPVVEPTRSIRLLLEDGTARLGADRIAHVHPGCGERNLPLDIAYQKNVNMTLARDFVFFGEPEPASPKQLGGGSYEEYDPFGYFVIQVDHDSKSIVMTLFDYENMPKVSLQSTSSEKLIAAVIEKRLVSDTIAGKKHLGYLGIELGKAETAVKNKVPYRQDRPLSVRYS
jgi:5-methyltetrahydropteroyltriglutamate--homocysteine methyltransferase